MLEFPNLCFSNSILFQNNIFGTFPANCMYSGNKTTPKNTTGTLHIRVCTQEVKGKLSYNERQTVDSFLYL